MKIKRFVVGSFYTNCYIMYSDTYAFIIDPGDNPKKIKSFIDDYQLEVVAIFLTHGHIDHIKAVESLYNEYHCDIYIHQEDAILLDHPEYNLSFQFGNEYVLSVPVKYYPDTLYLKNHEIKIHHTPGHTPGSCMIEFIKEKVIFSGDTLFRGSIGRTDFPLSSWSDMKASLSYIKTLDYDALVLPGHDNTTTLKEEKENNPYM